MTAPRPGTLCAMDWAEFDRLVDAGHWPRGVDPERLALLRAELLRRPPLNPDALAEAIGGG